MAATPVTALLGDIRVVELATMVFAPSASVVLADFGAEVIKVEAPDHGDLNRNYHTLPGMPKADIPYTFQTDNRNKKSVVLDLKSAAGRHAMLKLIDTADVFVTNMRPAALARLQLDYDSVKTLNTRLIYAHATAYGETGPEKDKPGYDTICYFSRSAIESHVFPYEGWLNAFPFGAGDHPSGMSLFAAIMCALYQRQRTGTGCKVSSSLLANGAWANATLLQAQFSNAQFQEKRPRSNAYSFTTQHYPTRDGRLIKMGIVNVEKDWPSLCAAVGRQDLAADPRFETHQMRLQNMATLIQELSVQFMTQDVDYWLQQLALHDIPHAKVANYQEAASDPQKEAIGAVVPLVDPENKQPHSQLKTVSSPFEIGGYKKAQATVAPALGEHTEEVLTSLGLSSAELDSLT